MAYYFLPSIYRCLFKATVALSFCIIFIFLIQEVADTEDKETNNLTRRGSVSFHCDTITEGDTNQSFLIYVELFSCVVRRTKVI